MSKIFCPFHFRLFTFILNETNRIDSESSDIFYDKNVRTNAFIAVRHNGQAVTLGAHCTQVTENRIRKGCVSWNSLNSSFWIEELHPNVYLNDHTAKRQQPHRHPYTLCTGVRLLIGDSPLPGTFCSAMNDNTMIGIG